MSRGTQSTTDAGSAPPQATRFISRPAHTPGPKPWLPYAAAVVATALAAALRGWLTTLVGPSLSPFLTYYPVVMLVAILGGAGPGLLATALTALAVAYLSLPPTGSVAVHSPADQLALVLFCAINMAVTLICAAFRAARHHTLTQICRAQASEVRYRRLFEAARDGVLLLDTRSHKITDANPFFLQLLGYSRQELLGKELWQIGLLKDAPASRAAFDQLATTGHIRYEDLPLQAKTGEPREVELVSIVYDENGRSVIQCNVRDITDRKRAEAERTALREQLAADLAAMNYLHDLSTRFLSYEDPKLLLESTLDVAIAIARASKGNIQLLDSASNQLAISVHRGFNEQFIQYFSHIHPGQAACGTILQTHQRIIVEDITLSPIFAADPRALQLKLAAGVRAVTCTPLLSRANQLLGVLSVHFPAPHRPTDRDLRLLDLLARQAADFTERTQTEAALRQSETRLRLATETAELGTYERDLLTNRLTFNATCRAIMGFTGDQPPPDVARRSIHPDDEERVLAAVARAYAPDLREICAAEFRILRPDGTFRWVAGRGRVLFDDSAMPPRPARFIGVLNDITDRKRREEALHEQAHLARLRADLVPVLQEQVPLPNLLQHVTALLVERLDAASAQVWTLAPAGRTLELQANAGLDTHLEGHHSRLPVGQLGIGRIAQERRSFFTNQVLGDPNIPNQDWARREGMVAFAGCPLLLEGRLLGVVALFARHALSPASIETLTTVAWSLAQGLGRLLAEQALRSNEARLSQAVLVARLGTFDHDQFSGEIEYSPRLREILGFAPDESLPLPALFERIPPENRQQVAEAIRRTHDPAGDGLIELEHPITVPGQGTRWLSVRAHTFFDGQGPARHAVRTIGAVLDITDQKEFTVSLEHTVQERTAKLRETIAELEGFSYSLVHDMRAPLRAMLSYAGILELEAGERFAPEHSDLLRKIKLAALRMDQLVTDSLNYNNILRQNLPLGPVDLGGLIHGMVETYPNLQPPHADITVEITDLIVHGNQAALTQVFSNLLGNAVKFVAPGVHPHVRVWAEPPAPSTASSPPSTLNRFVRIWVEDNGIGIPKDQQGKIFGMFQRLHGSNEYSGTGIGLALVRKSLDRTSGQVCLDSEPGRGSRFCVQLPLASPAQTATDIPAAA